MREPQSESNFSIPVRNTEAFWHASAESAHSSFSCHHQHRRPGRTRELPQHAITEDHSDCDALEYMSRCFVTVGSTHFDPLVEAVLSPLTLDALHLKGYTELVVQCGKYARTTHLEPRSSEGPWSWRNSGVEISVFRYKPSLQDEYDKADLVISHAGVSVNFCREIILLIRTAGSGTILDVLRKNIPLIVVPNPTLLDNHQVDLASELHERRHLKACTVQYVQTF